jgi:hypothetical protein
MSQYYFTVIFLFFIIVQKKREAFEEFFSSTDRQIPYLQDFFFLFYVKRGWVGDGYVCVCVCVCVNFSVHRSSDSLPTILFMC